MCNIKNKMHKYFGYLTLANSKLQSQVRGSSQPFVSYDMLYEIKAVIPPDNVIEHFENRVKPLFEQIFVNQCTIKELIKLQATQLTRLTGSTAKLSFIVHFFIYLMQKSSNFSGNLCNFFCFLMLIYSCPRLLSFRGGHFKNCPCNRNSGSPKTRKCL